MSDTRDDARVLLELRKDLLTAEAAEERRRVSQRKRREQAQRRARPRRPPILPEGAPQTAVDTLVRRQEYAKASRLARESRFTFWDLLGDIPQCGPGETLVARAFHHKILRTLDAGPWSHDERSYLLKLEKVWASRAAGNDVRFTLAGNRSGRLPRDIERRIQLMRRSRI